MPNGAIIKMRRESAYINAELFMDWLVNHFVPRKPAGKCLLLLDGHAAHMNSYEMLETAVRHDIIILCLPSHTTHFLQPLDRSFFKPLKSYFRSACDEFVTANPHKKIERRHFGMLLSTAWTKAATAKTGTSAFSSTGIWPLKPSVVPEHAYLSSSQSQLLSASDNDERTDNESDDSSDISLETLGINSSLAETSKATVTIDSAIPGTSTKSFIKTPTKILVEISPIPVSDSTVRSKRKQSAQNLTEASFIAEKKAKKEKKDNAERKKLNKKRGIVKKEAKGERRKKGSLRGLQSATKRLFNEDSSSEEEDHFSVNDSSDYSDEYKENECVECLEQYEDTKSRSDWIKCIRCSRWLHETCSIYEDKCGLCGRIENKKNKQK